MIHLSTMQIFLMIFIPGLITQILRALPFVVFGRRAISPTIRTLGATLPFVIMAVLVVYCLKSIPTGSLKENLKLLAAVLLVAGLHLTKKTRSSRSASEPCSIWCWCTLPDIGCQRMQPYDRLIIHVRFRNISRDTTSRKISSVVSRVYTPRMPQ